MKIAYIVDSTAGLKDELKQHPDVNVLNLTINFSNGDVYEDSTENSKVKAFYQRLNEEKQLPTTAQPSLGEYYQLMDQLIANNYQAVIVINLSSQLSGTFQTSQMVLNEYSDRLKVTAIDSRATSVVIENMLEQALEMQNMGLTFEEINEKLNWLAEESHIYMVIEDLNNLVKSGRLSSANAFLGSLLQIKPLLEFTDTGAVQVIEKIRTEKKVYKRWEEIVENALQKFPNGIHLRFAHGDAYEAVAAVQEKMKKKFPQIKSFGIGYLTPAVGVHGGNGVKGMAIIPDVIN